MTVDEARKVIRDDTATPIAWLKATTVLVSPEKFSDSTTYLDLLKCLKRGVPCASSAAMTLYFRTGRQRPDDILHYIHDAGDWESYLRGHGFIV